MTDKSPDGKDEVTLLFRCATHAVLSLVNETSQPASQSEYNVLEETELPLSWLTFRVGSSSYRLTDSQVRTERPWRTISGRRAVATYVVIRI